MNTQTTTDDKRYAALLARDPAEDGRWFVGVRTTGIFCRSTCPARKPKRENCAFFETVAECLAAGFRPCLRCSPVQPAAQAEPMVRDLVRRLQEAPARRWREADVAALGYDPSSVRRAFRRHFGTTFLALARQSRLGQGFVALGKADSVISAQLDAGFDSSSGFRDAFARLLGIAPGHLCADAALRADWIGTPIGAMLAVSDREGLHLLEFVDRRALPGELRRLAAQHPGGIGVGRFGPTDQVAAELADYFAGRSARFDTPLKLAGTPFSRTVWQALREIPAGETRSYAALAVAIGRPTAMRAVARANGANQLAIVVPCHRVIGADGSLTGYGGGLWRKQNLIDIETGYRQSATRMGTAAG